MEKFNICRVQVFAICNGKIFATFLVVERFLKSASKAWVKMMIQQPDAASKSYVSLGQNRNSSVLRFPALEALVDVFE